MAGVPFCFFPERGQEWKHCLSAAPGTGQVGLAYAAERGLCMEGREQPGAVGARASMREASLLTAVQAPALLLLRA